MNLNWLIIALSMVAALFGVWIDFGKRENRKWGVVLSIIIIASGVLTYLNYLGEVEDNRSKEKAELKRYERLLSNLENQLERIESMDTSVTERLVNQVQTLSKLDTQLSKDLAQSQSMASELEAASEQLTGHLKNFESFENKINNEVFEVWVEISGGITYSSSNDQLRFANRYLQGQKKDSVYRSYVREPYQHKIQSNDSLLSYLRTYDFREVNWQYKSDRVQAILNFNDFDKASVRYKKSATDGSQIPDEKVSFILMKSFPVDHFATNLDNKYLLFDDFKDTKISLLANEDDAFSLVYTVTLYLIGSEKMKELVFMKSFEDDFIGQFKLINHGLGYQKIEMTLDSKRFDAIPFTRKGNVMNSIQ